MTQNKTDLTERPLLSVIMPNYNHARYLPESLGAVLSQTYDAVEVLVIDDRSTDDSVEVIEGIARLDPRVHLIRNEINQGVSNNCNKGLEMSRGRYVYFAAADDRILPGFFEKSMGLLLKHPEAGLCCTLEKLIDENGQDLGLAESPVISPEPCFLNPAEALEAWRRHRYWILGVTVIYRREALLEAGRFSTELHSHHDMFVALVTSLRYGVCFVPEVLTSWRIMPQGHVGVTRAGGLKLEIEILRKTLGLMRTQYSHLFPATDVDAYEAEQRRKLDLWREEPAPLLSVVVPNFNHAQFLPQSLGAILDQSYDNLEVIVIDDASTDESVKVVEGFLKNNSRLRLARNEKNQGIIPCLNLGLNLAQGEYIYFAAADDMILPGFFAKSMSLLIRHPQAAVSCTLERLMDEEGRDLGPAVSPVVSAEASYFPPDEAKRLWLQHRYWLMGVTAIYRRPALLETGGFHPELRSHTDVFTALVLSLRHGACFIPERLARWRLSDSGYTRTTITSETSVLLELLDHTLNLMRTTYSHLFSPEEVKAFGKEERRKIYLSRRPGKNDGLDIWLKYIYFKKHRIPRFLYRRSKEALVRLKDMVKMR
ncbi:MAG: glycosyltransferase [Thermodesulfobacteriota bacterium]